MFHDIIVLHYTYTISLCLSYIFTRYNRAYDIVVALLQQKIEIVQGLTVDRNPEITVANLVAC